MNISSLVLHVLLECAKHGTCSHSLFGILPTFTPRAFRYVDVYKTTAKGLQEIMRANFFHMYTLGKNKCLCSKC